MPCRREPYVPCSRRKRADADAVGKSGTVVLSFKRGAGSANSDAGDDYVVDGGLAFVSKHDEPPDESIVLGQIGSVSTLFVPCRDAGWLIPFDVVLPVPFGLVVLADCGNQGPQGNESDECLDNKNGDIYIVVRSHWMVTGLASCRECWSRARFSRVTEGWYSAGSCNSMGGQGIRMLIQYSTCGTFQGGS